MSEMIWVLGRIHLFDNKALMLFSRVREAREYPGGPKYEGESGDVYENKRPKKSPPGESGDVYENKQVMIRNRRWL